MLQGEIGATGDMGEPGLSGFDGMDGARGEKVEHICFHSVFEFFYGYFESNKLVFYHPILPMQIFTAIIGKIKTFLVISTDILAFHTE